MMHHPLDPYPIPKDKTPLYINEPHLIDKSLSEMTSRSEPEAEDDNIRVYLPMDLNRKAILRRLHRLINHYGEANENNEWEFSEDVSLLIAQIEIYDRIWYIRHMPREGDHSAEGIELVKEFVALLEKIPDGCAECFPFEQIVELKREYISKGGL